MPEIALADAGWAAALIVVLVACWTASFFGLPGNVLIVVAAGVYAYAAPVEPPLTIGWPVVAAIAALAVVGELLETLAGAMGARKVGGSRRGAVLALVGSLVGGIVGLFVGIPIPIIGSLVAAVFFASLGAFCGALLGEYWKGRETGQSLQVAKAAFWGRLLGTLAKTALGAVMIVLAAGALWV